MLINTLYKDNEEISIESYLNKCGINSVEEYLKPTGKAIESPYIYTNMIEAVQLFKYHYLNNSTVYIIQDGDTDGIVSSVIMYNYIKLLSSGTKVKLLLHKGKERGLNDDEVFDKIVQEKPNLLIIPDAGTNEVERTRQLFDSGVDIIVLDHHDIITPIDCGVLINNNLQKCNNYGSGGLVTHKFLQALDKEFGKKYSGKFIDLVALSIISDSMNVTSLENRCYIKFGLFNGVIYNDFLYKLINDIGYDNYTIRDIAFKVVPKLNAVIRGDSQEDKQRVTMAFLGMDNIEEVADLCKKCHEEQIKTVSKFVSEWSDFVCDNDNKVNIVCSDSIQRSYSGLLAGKLSSLSEKPCIVGKCKDGEIIGSFRGNGVTRKQIESMDGVNWANGHDVGAFGISINESKLQELQCELNTLEIAYNPHTDVLQSYTVNSIPKGLYDLFEPYNALWSNQGLPKPMFYIHSIKFNSKDIKLIGAKNNTIKIQLPNVDILYFNTNEQVREDFCVDKNEKLELECICTFSMNEWNGKKTPQIIIESGKYEIKEQGLITFEDLF